MAKMLSGHARAYGLDSSSIVTYYIIAHGAICFDPLAIYFYCCCYMEHVLRIFDDMYSCYFMFWEFIDEQHHCVQM